MDFSQLTLGQLLASTDQTVRRGAIQCYKRLLALKDDQKQGQYQCPVCNQLHSREQTNPCLPL